MRKAILSYINETLIGEKAHTLYEDQTLKESGLDSFGYIVLWMALEAKYGKCFEFEDISSLVYDETTLKMIIDRIEDAQSNQS